MKILFNTLFVLSLISSFAIKVVGQERSSSSLVERDSIYSALMEKQSLLLETQEQLKAEISSKRTQIATSNDKEKLSSEILDMESKLFDMRGEIGEVTSKINEMDKANLLQNLNAHNETGHEGAVSTSGGRNLLTSDIVRKNLSSEEYNIVSNSAKEESELTAFADEIALLYRDYRAEVAAYKKAITKDQADSIRSCYEDVLAQLEDKDAEFGDRWHKLTEVRFDSYNILLDKMAAYESIESLGNSGRDVRSEISTIQSSVVAPEVASFNRERLLLMKYEVEIAKVANIGSAVDSVTILSKKVRPTKYDLPLAELPTWVFVNFEPINIGAKIPYNAENPLPELVLPTRGEFYMLELGTYSKKLTSYVVFRKISPMWYRESEGGKFTYYAGRYLDKDEATADYNKLRRYGMKVSLTHWKDGNQIAEDGSIIEYRPAGDLFRVEIDELTDEITAIVREEEPNKEIMKGADSDVAYSIGLFDTYDKAKSLANKIGSGAKVVGIKISTDLDD